MIAMQAPSGITSFAIGGAEYLVQDGVIELPPALADEAVAHGFWDPAHPPLVPQSPRPIGTSVDRTRLQVALADLEQARDRAAAASRPLDKLRARQEAAESALSDAQRRLDEIAAAEQADLVAEAVNDGGAAVTHDRTAERQRAALVKSECERELGNIRAAAAALEVPARAAALHINSKIAEVEDAAAAVLADQLAADMKLMSETIESLNRLQFRIAGIRLALSDHGHVLLAADDQTRALALFRGLEALSARLGEMTRLRELSPAIERRAADQAANWLLRLTRDPAAELEPSQ